MKSRKRYFVSVTKQTITKISIDDSDEYEIFATHEEITELKKLLRAKDDRNFWFTVRNLVFDPLAKTEDGPYHDEENEYLKRIYQFVYLHGTEETRIKIESLGLMGDRMLQS